MESLCSNSNEMQLASVTVLDSLLQQRDSREELVPIILSNNKALSTLIGMLGTDVRDGDTRLFAARVTANLADRLKIAEIPGMVNLVSSLLDAKNQPAVQKYSAQTASSNGEGITVGCSWVFWFWQRMKAKWSIPEELPLTHLDLFPVLGMVILEKLACDLDNCTEIVKYKNLVSKIIGLINYTTDDGSSNDAEQNAVICSSLNLLRQLAITGEKIGAMLRQELQKNPFLLGNIANILEDTRSNPQLWKSAMDIIAKLALDKKAGKEIGRRQVIVGKLMHAFFRRYGPTSMDDDQSLPMVAGEALANLALCGTANCLAILEEPGIEAIQDLKNMLCEDKYRYAAANLLQNLCAHCRVKMSHPDASEHLLAALTIVMKHMEAVEGKKLESLIGLASEISDVIREAFVQELESQTNNGAGFVQKLVSTLNSSMEPNPEYLRMRRVIVKTVITILESCHCTVERMMKEGVMDGLMEALTKIERTPSKVEKYRVFYGGIGVVLESGSSLSAQVAKAKGLIADSAASTSGA
ncbi:unnamed protein product [Urochloa humidicola]